MSSMTEGSGGTALAAIALMNGLARVLKENRILTSAHVDTLVVHALNELRLEDNVARKLAAKRVIEAFRQAI